MTPTGRLLNRFQRETLTVDVSLPSALSSYGATLAAIVSSMAVVVASSPSFLVAAVPLAFMYRGFQRFYMSSSREIKRLESVTRAPLLTHVSESIEGLPTIRAYGASEAFVEAADACHDRNLRANLVSCFVNCWLGLRLELLGALVATLASTRVRVSLPTSAHPPPHFSPHL